MWVSMGRTRKDIKLARNAFRVRHVSAILCVPPPGPFDCQSADGSRTIGSGPRSDGLDLVAQPPTSHRPIYCSDWRSRKVIKRSVKGILGPLTHFHQIPQLGSADGPDPISNEKGLNAISGPLG